MRILYLTSRLPYPLYKGDKLRAYHQIKYLSRRHSVTLCSLIDSKEELSYINELEKYCECIETILLKPYFSYLSVFSYVFSRIPLQVGYYYSRKMKKKIDELLTSERFDIIHTQLVRMSPYIKDHRRTPKVLDMVDTLSLNMKRRLEKEKLLMKPLLHLEYTRLQKYEADTCRAFDKVIVCSECDKQFLSYNGNVSVCPNGVDTDFFYFTESTKGSSSDLCFLGNMGYFPNIDAVLFFVKNILPLVKKKISNVKFYIVGINPPGCIRNLARKDKDIMVTGFVEDVRSYLKKAAVAVYPIRSGSGIQNKVLEAMASGTAVVATRYALEGIQVNPEEHAIMADKPGEFASRVVQLLSDAGLRRRLAINARRLVEDVYDWDAYGRELETIYASAIGLHISKSNPTKSAL